MENNARIPYGYLLILFLLGSCHPEIEKIYDYCRIESFQSGDDSFITYFKYKDDLLVKKEKINQNGEIMDSQSLSYYPNGRWKTIISNQGYRDSAVYEADLFTVFEKSFYVYGADTIYSPINLHSIIYVYQNGNLRSYSFFNEPVGTTFNYSFKYNQDVARIDLRNLLTGFEYFPLLKIIGLRKHVIFQKGM